jgi:exosortase
MNPENKARSALALASAVPEGWRQQPDKLLFLGLAVPWIVLFHFWGNSTFGYIESSSLFGWMWFVCTTSADDQHCLFVPFVILGLLFWKREELRLVPKGLWWPGLIVVLLALVMHIAGYMVQQTRIGIMAFFLGLYGLTGLVWGWAWMRATFFPMFLLVFCVPLGTMAETLTFPMRLLASKISVGFSHIVLGIDVIQDGVQIFNSARTYQYEVAAACSGIRSLTSLLMLTTIYAFVSFKTGWKRWVMIGAAFPLAVVTNVARLIAVIVVAEAFGHEAGAYVETKFGFLTFGLALVLALVLGHWLQGREPQTVGRVEAKAV